MSILKNDSKRSAEIREIMESRGFLRGSFFAIALVDLKASEPKIFGVNLDEFVYPASVYKIFIGAEVLRQIEAGMHSLDEKIVVKSPNDVDHDARLFPGSSEPLLSAGESATIDKLLSLMLEQSDNTASNCLIDLVGRENITKNIILANGWEGSDVTRKFLDRSKEDLRYRFSETTKSCARHVAEFFYLIEKERLASPFVSRKLKEYMLKWNREGRKGLSIADYVFFYRKGGFLENNLYLPLYSSYYKKAGFAFDYIKNIGRLLKTVFTKGWAVIRWSHDAGVVTGKNSEYVAVVFTMNKQLNPAKRFPMEKLAKVVFEYMENQI